MKAFGRAVDQGDSEATKTFILDVAEEFGGIDAHISNATSTAESHSAEAWESAIAVDLMGAVNASKAVWPFLEAAAARYGDSSFLAISSNAASMSQRRRLCVDQSEPPDLYHGPIENGRPQGCARQ